MALEFSIIIVRYTGTSKTVFKNKMAEIFLATNKEFAELKSDACAWKKCYALQQSLHKTEIWLAKSTNSKFYAIRSHASHLTDVLCFVLNVLPATSSRPWLFVFEPVYFHRGRIAKGLSSSISEWRGFWGDCAIFETTSKRPRGRIHVEYSQTPGRWCCLVSSVCISCQIPNSGTTIN